MRRILRWLVRRLYGFRGFNEPVLDTPGPVLLLPNHTSWWDWLLIAIGAHQVNDRPGRVEPRARKRRRKQYPRLMQPRRVAKRRLGVEC